jgi:hypothetical protein
MGPVGFRVLGYLHAFIQGVWAGEGERRISDTLPKEMHNILFTLQASFTEAYALVMEQGKEVSQSSISEFDLSFYGAYPIRFTCLHKYTHNAILFRHKEPPEPH